ncbi:MAG: serine hydrolase domain-containing protein [Gemmatimonadota bacterium]
MARRRLTLICTALAAAACRPGAPHYPAPGCPEGRCEWSRLAATVDSAIAAGAAPGAVVAVSIRGIRYLHTAGRLGLDLPQRPDTRTLYDLASLTKVIALTTMTMIALDEHRVALDSPVVHYLPSFGGGEKDRVTIRHLLTHSSGLRAHRPLWLETPGRDSALGLVNATPLDTMPGVRTLYSDLGAIALTEIIESVYGERIDQLAAERIFKPLSMRSTRYLPPSAWLPRIAPTEMDPWRGHIVRGEVHDENAAWLGGVSGHAGLFSDAEDLLRFGEWLSNAWLRPSGGTTKGRAIPISTATIREFTRRQNVVAGSSRALGWDTPSEGSSAGTRLSAASFGHTGFTGTSLWIDPERQLVIVLLSNRVHPTRENPRLGPLRALVADRVVETLFGSGAGRADSVR